MENHEELLRWRVCRGLGCGEVFWICCHCDRGHRYCSERCREKKRRKQKRAANKKHRKSEEGRLDHRDRQQAYRERCRLRVMDQPSAPTGSDSIVETEPSPAKDGPGSSSVEARYAESAEFEPACIICGRTLGPAPAKRPSFPDGG